MNIQDLMTQYARELSDAPAHQTYRHSLAALQEFFKDHVLEVETLTTYRRWLRQREYARATVTLYVVVARRFLKWAVARELLDANLLVKIEAYDKTIGHKRNHFIRRQVDGDDIETILDYCKEPMLPIEGETARQRRDRLTYMRDRAIVWTLAGTGLRISEALSLNREPFDAFFGNWNGRREMILPVEGKGEKVADIIFMPPALARLEDYLGLRGNDGYPPLFVSHGNRKRNDGRLTRQTVNHFLTAVAKKLGIKPDSFTSPHAFRHHFLDTLANAGMDLRDLQSIARHSDPRTTVQAYIGPAGSKRLARIIRQATEE